MPFDIHKLQFDEQRSLSWNVNLEPMLSDQDGDNMRVLTQKEKAVCISRRDIW